MLFLNSLRFPNIFNIDTGSTELDSEYTSINRCIGLILTTARGELLGDPDFGCTLYERLFTAYTDASASQIKSDIVDSLTKYERRIIITPTDIEITPEDTTYNKFFIHITYRVKNSDLTNNITVSINNREVAG